MERARFRPFVIRHSHQRQMKLTIAPVSPRRESRLLHADTIEEGPVADGIGIGETRGAGPADNIGTITIAAGHRPALPSI